MVRAQKMSSLLLSRWSFVSSPFSSLFSSSFLHCISKLSFPIRDSGHARSRSSPPNDFPTTTKKKTQKRHS